MKRVKPQTNLKIDLFLFMLFLVVIISGMVMRTSSLGSHALMLFQRVHGWIGIVFCFLVSLHLFTHLPWLQSQLSRLFNHRKALATVPPSD